VLFILLILCLLFILSLPFLDLTGLDAALDLVH